MFCSHYAVVVFLPVCIHFAVVVVLPYCTHYEVAVFLAFCRPLRIYISFAFLQPLCSCGARSFAANTGKQYSQFYESHSDIHVQSIAKHLKPANI